MKDVEPSAKQQIIEKIKASSNILIIVSKDPSVDDLTAAIGLSALLNKIDKHATSIFSGILPPVLSFLDPTKVFENTVDSLRDFIIALDKEKADHLRYKIDGDMVKIFITPYRTSITSSDLDFSQGDYNVQLVVALGVSSRDHLDNAIASHSQVFVDADVVSLCAGSQSSQLGSVIWRDETASCLSEMIMSVSESLKTDKTLLDKQIATALLTGIVSSTERFSNNLTTSKVMTMAAQLMAAGADQQLIATKLREDHEIKQSAVIVDPVQPVRVDEAVESVFDTSTISEAQVTPVGELDIDHDAVDYHIVDQPVVDSESIETNIPEPVTINVEPIADEPVIESESVFGGNEVKTDTLESPQSVDDQQSSAFINNLASAISSAPNLNPTHELVLQPLSSSENPTIEPAEQLEVGSTLSSEDLAVNTFNNTQSVGYDTNPLSTLPPISIEQPTNYDDLTQSTDSTSEFSLPLPPQMPDFSTLPPANVPDFNASPDSSSFDSPISTISPEDQTNPSQFKIPS